MILKLVREKDRSFTLIAGDARIALTLPQAEALRDVLTVQLKKA